MSYYVLHYFLPPSLFSASQFRVWIPRPEIAFSPRVNSQILDAVGWGVAWVALRRAFPQTQKLVFFMISPYLLDICPVFLLVFSPLETADFLMFFKPLGDGYSLLCSQKTASAAQLHFEPFRFWLQIRGDICNRKTTP